MAMATVVSQDDGNEADGGNSEGNGEDAVVLACQ